MSGKFFGLLKNFKNIFLSFFSTYLDSLIHKISIFLSGIFGSIYGYLRWNRVDYAFVVFFISIGILVSPMINHFRFRPFYVQVKMTPMVPILGSDGYRVDHESRKKEEIRFKQGEAKADMEFSLHAPLEKLYIKFEVPDSVEFYPVDDLANSDFDRENKILRFESNVPTRFQYVVDLETELSSFSATRKLEIRDYIKDKEIKKFILKT